MKTLKHIWIVLLAAGMSLSAGGATHADSVALGEGMRLYEEGEYELARRQLMVSSRSEDGYVRAEAYLYINALEMELGNYDAARPWLEKYHAEMTRLSVERAVAQVNRRHNRILVSVGALIVVLAAAMFSRWRRQRVARPKPMPDPARWKSWLADADSFRRTPIYDEVERLAAQTERGREARVLSLSRQEVLDAELGRVFADFAAELRGVCPALTDGDVKLCCLSLVSLSSFGRALCFGSTETNIVKQRKHKIKQKLAKDDAGRRLFEFIFSEKRDFV